MRNSMIVLHNSGKNEHFICPCRGCKATDELNIPTFYSYKHAFDSGWVYTKEIKHCDPDNINGVWVCPSCYKTVKIRKRRVLG